MCVCLIKMTNVCKLTMEQDLILHFTSKLPERFVGQVNVCESTYVWKVSLTLASAIELWN